MERKRKLPARAAARVEQVSKKRTATPPDNRSATPVPTPPAAHESPVPAVPTLPKSIQPGKPLPTVDEPQAEDLSNKEYQSMQESGVLGESLQRSRQRWFNEGIFEKYWAKPTKRKGAVIEEPNNPSKDTMVRIGTATIFVEPHVLDVVMYAVKDPKPQPPLPPTRPVIQYGPPGGSMPLPPVPGTATNPATPTLKATGSPVPHATNSDAKQSVSAAADKAPTAPATPIPSMKVETTESQTSNKASVARPDNVAPFGQQDAGHVPSPHVAAQPSPSPVVASGNPPTRPPAAQTQSPYPANQQAPPPPHSTVAPSVGGANVPPPATPAPHNSRPPSSQPPPNGTDPIIVMLAEKATEDAQLRDLMKRVALGLAPKDELERFQAIIDEITLESKRKGLVQGPSADRLVVDGRTVRYFADEVRAILDIVLTTNPHQTSADLRPPAKSDPLVVELVKTALDEPKTRDIVRRIAENRPLFADATDLKLVLDKLKLRLVKEEEQKNSAGQAATSQGKVKTPTVNGHGASSSSSTPQQALRSKGPPPAPKPDITAVVIEFTNGTPDRFLFPKFSILEQVQGPNGPQMLASFLIIRKGSMSEYGGDPTLDYYQPITIRIQPSSPKVLDSLSRVVAPPEEVKRYMDDIMDNMTRAEYVLLAMRLPRAEKDDSEGGSEKDTSNGSTGPEVVGQVSPQDGPLWTTKAAAPSAAASQKTSKRVMGEDEKYQKLIASVTPMEVDKN